MTFTDFVCLLLGGAARPAGGAHGRAPGRTGRQAVAGREAGRARDGDRLAAPRALVHKNGCGPVRMHRPTAVWSKHQS